MDTNGKRSRLTKLRAGVSLLLALACAFVVYRYVELIPAVEGSFFFSSEDPQVQEDRKIARLFPTNAQVILSVATSDIRSLDYGTRVQVLGLELMQVPGVMSVKDLRHGPKNLNDALESPLWRRLLIAEDGKATHLIVSLDTLNYAKVIPAIERLVAKHNGPNFRIAISGVPYVVEQIHRSSLDDLRIFTAASLLIFVLFVGLIYRSLAILAGTVVSCVLAAMLTLIVEDLAGMNAGVLNANVATIVFVLTLSHIVFLTANWRLVAGEAGEASGDLVRVAARRTGPASFWAMVTTFLGFLSLALAPAKPLREFGLATALGALMAIAAAYLVFPAFLRLARQPKKKLSGGWTRVMERRLAGRHLWTLPVLALFFVLGLAGLQQLDRDPSLLSFFAEGSVLRQGLERIDREGGSSPLELVVRDREHGKLNNKQAFERLWDLQTDLEGTPAVGTVISLPVLMAEADRSPFSFLITWEGVLKRLDHPKHGRVARSFVTSDRKYGRFILRMKEQGRREPRQEVISRLHGIVHKHGFSPALTGGIYQLQAKLSELVTASIVSGLLGLLVFCVAVALFVSRSLRAGLATGVVLGVVVALLLGLTGWIRMPLDIVSAPAASIAIAMGIDAMIHLMYAVRRRRQAFTDWAAWTQARLDLWQPILASSAVVTAGFGVFLLSSFPPTARLGFLVAAGTILTVVMVLFVFPLLATLGRYRPVKNR